MVTPAFWGSEFRINKITDGFQGHSKVAALKNGMILAVWTDESRLTGDSSSGAIHGQLFNADGSRAGDEFLINTITNDNQAWPSVAVLRDGRFVVSWEDFSGTDGDQAIGLRAQIFELDPLTQKPVQVGLELHVNTTTEGYQQRPWIAALSDGGFAVSFYDGSGISSEIRSSVFDSSGNRLVKQDFLVTSAAGDQSNPTAVGLDNGNFAVFYQDYNPGSDDNHGTSVRGAILSSNGDIVRNSFLIPSSISGDQQTPLVTRLSDGRLVVVWVHGDANTGDGFGSCIKAQILNADGTKYRGEFLINTYTPGSQVEPAVTALADGGFFVAFADSFGGAPNIRAATFDANGTRTSDDFIINSHTSGSHRQPSLATLADGRILVSWNDTDPQSEDPISVRAQIVDPRAHGMTFGGTGLNDQYVGTRFADTLSGAGGADRLQGEAGDDVLSGGEGTDRLDGGEGFDTVSYAGAGAVSVNLATGGNLQGDTLVSIEGVIGSAAGDSLSGSSGHVLQGAAGHDTYLVSGSALVVEAAGQGTDTVLASGSYSLSRSAEVEVLRFDSLTGTGRFSLSGSDTANAITGNKGANVIHGYGGTDVIRAGLGNDQLWGGAGRDTFVFDSRPHSRSNKDAVKDYKVADDRIFLENGIFRGLGRGGSEDHPRKLAGAQFWTGAKAHDASDRIIYNKKTGALYYDEDGTGTKAQVQIATLSKNLKMTAAELFVI